MLVSSSNTTQKTYYEILSVREDAGIDEIRTGYKAALLNAHPDKLPKQPDLTESDNNEQEFLVVQKAWEVLSNSQSRSQYDKELAASRRKVEVVANEIELEDMNLEHCNDGEHEFLYPCRCGDYFGISSVELKAMGVLVRENGEVEINDSNFLPVSVILQCGSCSLKVRLLIEANV
ncbi:DNAJ heat shock N-terminal domain-containing protein-like [Rhynchospora pubera]|uniref:DNAJ heat shock N-terminal domain-containing protein-like n=1 Tax=Rhynchospora pubera TaxID=906938 RepID=A0AAV8GBT4_9POAL|nr:DNAJ heat shock N-terminal domain-containing protein-like [Rhynchospora pubera]